MRVRMLWIKELNNMKSTFINIEMDVSDFKIWGMRFPNLCFWIFFLYHFPNRTSDIFPLDCRVYKQQIQRIVP